jgi:hypothetical protein
LRVLRRSIGVVSRRWTVRRVRLRPADVDQHRAHLANGDGDFEPDLADRLGLPGLMPIRSHFAKKTLEPFNRFVVLLLRIVQAACFCSPTACAKRPADCLKSGDRRMASRLKTVWGAEIRFSRSEAIFVDQSAEPISALDTVWSR